MQWDVLKREISKVLAETLDRRLPEIGGNNWWKNYVIDELTPAQRLQVNNLPEPDIFQLDMAALLRLLDRNWSELVFKCGYPKSGKSLVKELIAVRNRWAHEPATGHDIEHLYTDLELARKFLALLDADKGIINSINDYRQEILSQLVERTNKNREIDKKFAEIEAAHEENHNGTNLAILGAKDISNKDNPDFIKPLRAKTFIGIDFGTSTTVASYIVFSDEDSAILVKPIKMQQRYADGRLTQNELIPSCIAINPLDGEALFGIGAKELQYQLREGIDVWSSFKMELGIDLGPKYRNTKLKKGKNSIFIEKPQDATREFFKFLKKGIEDYLHKNNLPKDIALAVSVPASFESNPLNLSLTS